MPKAGRPPKPELDWYTDVAKLMIRDEINFTAACQAIGQKVDRNIANLENTKAFQRVYWRERNSFYEGIGGDPTLTKNVVMGCLARSIMKLEEKQDFDKVATASATLAKIAGWMKDEPGTTVFATLTQQQIDEVKAKIRGQNVSASALGPVQ